VTRIVYDLCGLAEIASRLGVSVQRVDQLAKLDDFPEPVARLASGRVWLTDDIRAWAKTVGREMT
jgi:prophage regulatory protein